MSTTTPSSAPPARLAAWTSRLGNITDEVQSLIHDRDTWLMPRERARPGLGDPPGLGVCRGGRATAWCCRIGCLGCGEQVPGAGQQLTGDRDVLGDHRHLGALAMHVDTDVNRDCRVSSPELGISHPERPATGLSWEEARPL